MSGWPAFRGFVVSHPSGAIVGAVGVKRGPFLGAAAKLYTVEAFDQTKLLIAVSRRLS